MITTAKNWIRNKFEALRHNYEAVKKAVSSRMGPKTSESNDEAAEGRRKFADALGSFTDFFGNLAQKFNENAQLEQFITMGESFRQKGYYAGQWGVHEQDIEGAAAMQVRITKNLIEEKSQSNQRKLESQVKILKTIKKNAKRDYENKNAYYEKLNRAYQYNHKQFSLPLGLIYGFFALVLVLADIPLALELTKRGFDLKSDEESAISELFAYGTDEGFLFHFLKVLTVNWEVVVFATGVAFCTIYIKIFYDDYIGVPLENLIKKASESPRAEYEEFHQAESDQPANSGSVTTTDILSNKKKVTDNFNRLWWVRFFVKLGVLLVLIFTILVLGYFRYSVVRAQNATVTGALVTLLTYSLPTLIFPMISGICASLSLSNFHNWAERRRAGKENSEARKAVLKATDEYRVAEEEKERNSGFIKWLSSEETIKQLTDYLIRCYESGFKFGYLHPEWNFGGDLFTRAEAIRNRNLIVPDSPTNGVGPVKPVPVTHSALN